MTSAEDSPPCVLLVLGFHPRHLVTLGRRLLASEDQKPHFAERNLETQRGQPADPQAHSRSGPRGD